ncbi:hypothetical protein Nepgr_000040 [Nepenthes gracilis]|uniref:Uncharacterized protein n=1 Tax=Nepenthes gracilis TaxID=150966 RepID=A0AAD3P2P5_NEPGR|nr:hypothetical protein Nepgr_000040 [Nepenthes gracilis]
MRLAIVRTFHTSFMEPALIRLEAVLAATEIRTKSILVISNVDGQPHAQPATIKKLLAHQEIASKTILSIGLKKSNELGPGKE